MGVSYLASTVDGQPYNRAMMLIHHREKFYYATFVGDKKVDQLVKNPHVAVCVPIGKENSEGSIRLRGKVEFIVDPDVRSIVHGCAGFIQGFWEDPQHPEFTLLEFKPEILEYMKPGSMETVRLEFQV
ncbi:hypothetical protein GF326_11880 [Candidatus Bathyarchaeota archaeon]|nr:hypothetical protein [Candidatus Bathyarchaeota archaeon]